MIGSSLYLFNRSGGGFSSSRLVSNIFFEILLSVVIGGILYIRGWNFEQLKIKPSLRLTGIGLLLFLGASFASGMAARLVGYFDHKAANHLATLMTGNPNVFSVVVLSFINPLYEEILLLGYLVTAIERIKNVRIAIITSIVIRVSCHFYQGAAGAVGIFVMAVLFTYAFVRLKQLWPMIIAHGIWNLMGLLMIK